MMVYSLSPIARVLDCSGEDAETHEERKETEEAYEAA